MKHNILQGIRVALTTYQILIKHKKLLIYMAIPICIRYLFDTFIPHAKITYAYTLLHPTIAVWFGVALICHIHHILRHHKESWISSIQDTIPRAWTIVSWGVIAFFAIALSYPAESMLTKLGIHSTFITLPFAAAWALLTSFIIAIIASEPLPLLQMIKESFVLIEVYFLEIIGGTIIFMSFLIIPALLASFLNLVGILSGDILYNGILLVITIIFQTAMTIFASLILRHYQRKISRDIIIDIRTLYIP